MPVLFAKDPSNPTVELAFGYGDLSVKACTNEHRDAILAFVVLEKPKEVGESFKYDPDDPGMMIFPYYLSFNNPRSIDIVIKKLEELKNAVYPEVETVKYTKGDNGDFSKN